jgi:ATP adenylyltransferase
LLVLNKFPIIVEHFILATKTNKQQTHILEQDDLEATYACLKAWQDGEAQGKRRRLFAFFNSGEHSGASQPHRHLQFLPVENMADDEQSSGWDPLIDIILSRDTSFGLRQQSAIPFTHFAVRLPANPTGPQLLNIYNDLYKAAKHAVDVFIAINPGSLTLNPTNAGSLPISYNLAMTLEGMAICPRRAEGSMLRRDDGTEIGFIALNGTTLGGTLMVKHQEEWDVLRAQPEKLESILEAIGIP